MVCTVRTDIVTMNLLGKITDWHDICRQCYWPNILKGRYDKYYLTDKKKNINFQVHIFQEASPKCNRFGKHFTQIHDLIAFVSSVRLSKLCYLRYIKPSFVVFIVKRNYVANLCITQVDIVRTRRKCSCELLCMSWAIFPTKKQLFLPLLLQLEQYC